MKKLSRLVINADKNNILVKSMDNRIGRFFFLKLIAFFSHTFTLLPFSNILT